MNTITITIPGEAIEMWIFEAIAKQRCHGMEGTPEEKTEQYINRLFREIAWECISQEKREEFNELFVEIWK